MLRRWLLGLAALGVLTGQKVPALGQSLPRDERVLRTDLQRWFGKLWAAYRDHDLDGYLAHFSPDYGGTDFSGNTWDRPKLEEMTRDEWAANPKHIAVRMDLERISERGDHVVVFGTTLFDSVWVDRSGALSPKGSRYPIRAGAKFKWRLVRSGNGWLVKEQSLLAILPGKAKGPLPPRSRAGKKS
jgi:hypothetical protein